MFNATLTLDDASGDAVTYSQIYANGADGTKRLDQATTLSQPGLMQIKHSVSGGNGNQIDRHLVQFSRTVMSSGVPRVLTVNFTISVPRDPVITSTMVYDAVSNLIDFISDGGFSDTGIAGTTTLAALLRGEA